MNIVTPFPSININTANVHTEMAEHDKQLREVIPAPAASSSSNTENKAQSDTEKAKLPSYEGLTYDASGKLAGEDTVEQRDENTEESTDEEQQEEQDSAEQEEQELAQEQEQITELKARDTEVRIHEQAHASVGGQYAGSPSYEYERGPDGTNYAVSGEVQIDVSEIPNDPQATINKMQTVRAAALAPAEPSSADRSIAADATKKLAAAQTELSSTTATQDEDENETSEANFSSDEKSTAESEAQYTRDSEVDERAERIASFYQVATSSPSSDGFSAQI
jgi:hypothetical protein